MLRAIALSVVLLAVATVGGATPIRYADGRLSGRIERRAPEEVLRVLARAADLEIVGTPLADVPADIEWRNVPLFQALNGLLGRQSFFIQYAGSRPRRVVLLGVSAGGAGADDPGPRGTAIVLAATGPPASETPAAGEAGDADDPAVASNRRVEVGGPLAQAAGADSVSFSGLSGLAMRHDDPAVRAEALRVGLSILDSEPALNESLLAVLAQREDVDVALWLREAAGPHALEVVRATAQQASHPTLRARAAGIARHLEIAPR